MLTVLKIYAVVIGGAISIAVAVMVVALVFVVVSDTISVSKTRR